MNILSNARLDMVSLTIVFTNVSNICSNLKKLLLIVKCSIWN